jgi:hypothetical protein
MKNSIFYLIIVALIFTSCKEAHDETHKKEKVEQVKAAVDPTNISCITIDKRVYPQTAWIWAESWVSAYNHLYPNDTVSVAPEVYFERSKLLELKMKSKMEATGVRIYYILRKVTDKIPSLAIVNTLSCDNIQGEDPKKDKSVLVHWVVDAPLNTPNPEFVTYKSFEDYQNNWKTADQPRTGYVSVNAYNYAWETIENLYKDEAMLGIRVKYGVRTLELSEEKEYGVEINPERGELPITGNIVACNVVMGWDNNSLTFEDALRALDGDPEGLDFAKPCPHFCGE